MITEGSPTTTPLQLDRYNSTRQTVDSTASERTLSPLGDKFNNSTASPTAFFCLHLTVTLTSHVPASSRKWEAASPSSRSVILLVPVHGMRWAKVKSEETELRFPHSAGYAGRCGSSPVPGCTPKSMCTHPSSRSTIHQLVDENDQRFHVAKKKSRNDPLIQLSALVKCKWRPIPVFIFHATIPSCHHTACLPPVGTA